MVIQLEHSSFSSKGFEEESDAASEGITMLLLMTQAANTTMKMKSPDDTGAVLISVSTSYNGPIPGTRLNVAFLRMNSCHCVICECTSQVIKIAKTVYNSYAKLGRPTALTVTLFIEPKFPACGGSP